jgi:hypothetical protein
MGALLPKPVIIDNTNEEVYVPTKKQNTTQTSNKTKHPNQHTKHIPNIPNIHQTYQTPNTKLNKANTLPSAKIIAQEEIRQREAKFELNRQ